jgi:hypothetical protein
MSQTGNASLAVLILLFAISAVFLSAAAFSGGLIKLSYGITGDYNEKAFLAAEAQKVIALMRQDQTPEADSGLDPVWTEIIMPSTPGLELKLEDISSKINPNASLEYPLLALNLLKPEKTYDEFHKYRTANGPLTDIRHAYADFIPEDALARLCSEYAFFNINTANESMLYLLFEARTGKKASATTFPNHLRLSRTNKTLITKKTIKAVLGVDYDTVYPYISAEPELNVNLADKDILTALFAVVKNTFKIELQGDGLNAILTMREQSEINDATLAAVIQPHFKNTILESYLGCKTWFWRLTVKKDSLMYQCVILRLPAPPAETEKEPRFRLVAETYLKSPPKPDVDTGKDAANE